MGVPIEVFELHRFDGAHGCAHHLLLRASRPGFSNADQAANDAAEAFAESALAHLRGWWERHRLPVDCHEAHERRLVGVLHEVPVGEELQGPGLRFVDIWLAATAYGEPWVVLGTAASAEEFWEEAADPDLASLGPHGPAERIGTYFLTDRDGSGDLSRS